MRSPEFPRTGSAQMHERPRLRKAARRALRKHAVEPREAVSTCGGAQRVRKTFGSSIPRSAGTPQKARKQRAISIEHVGGREATEPTRRRSVLSTQSGDFCPGDPFAVFGHPALEDQLRRRFAAPTEVQAAAWPLVLSGRDVIAVASTGSGKTLAFLLPLFMRLRGPRSPKRIVPTLDASKTWACPRCEHVNPPHWVCCSVKTCKAPRPEGAGVTAIAAPPATPAGLVLVPTRELAKQVFGEAVEFGAVCDARAAVVYRRDLQWI